MLKLTIELDDAQYLWVKNLVLDQQITIQDAEGRITELAVSSLEQLMAKSILEAVQTAIGSDDSAGHLSDDEWLESVAHRAAGLETKEVDAAELPDPPIPKCSRCGETKWWYPHRPITEEEWELAGCSHSRVLYSMERRKDWTCDNCGLPYRDLENEKALAKPPVSPYPYWKANWKGQHVG